MYTEFEYYSLKERIALLADAEEAEAPETTDTEHYLAYPERYAKYKNFKF